MLFQRVFLLFINISRSQHRVTRLLNNNYSRENDFYNLEELRFHLSRFKQTSLQVKKVKVNKQLINRDNFPFLSFLLSYLPFHVNPYESIVYEGADVHFEQCRCIEAREA